PHETSPRKAHRVRRLVLFLSVATLVVAGLAVPAAASTSSLAQVQVQGAFGQKPKVRFSKPFAVSKSSNRLISAGTGEKLAAGAKVMLDYTIVDGRTGGVLETSFGASPQAIILDAQQAPAGLVSSLLGAPIGSRVLAAIAPKEGIAKSLVSQ